MQIPGNSNTLLYVHDPMCSWCWGFARAYDELIERLPNGVPVVRILGGLAPDSDEPMPEDMKNYLKYYINVFMSCELFMHTLFFNGRDNSAV